MEVAVGLGHGIESFLTPPVLDLADQALRGQQLQVAVYGAQADMGQAFLDPEVDVVGRRVVGGERSSSRITVLCSVFLNSSTQPGRILITIPIVAGIRGVVK